MKKILSTIIPIMVGLASCSESKENNESIFKDEISISIVNDRGEIFPSYAGIVFTVEDKAVYTVTVNYKKEWKYEAIPNAESVIQDVSWLVFNEVENGFSFYFEVDAKQNNRQRRATIWITDVNDSSIRTTINIYQNISENQIFYDLLPDAKNVEIESKTTFSINYRVNDSFESNMKLLCQGVQDGNYWFGLFDIIDESESEYSYFYDWRDPVNQEERKTIDKGYGDITTHTFLSKALSDFYVLTDESFSFIINRKYTQDQNFSKLVFSDSNDEIIDLDGNITSVNLWFENNIIVDYGIYNLSYIQDCYNKSGGYEFTFKTNPYISTPNGYLPISLTKGLKATSTTQLVYGEFTYHYEVSVFDFKENIECFSILTEELPDDNIRYDGLHLTKKDGIIWYYSLNLTLYSGAKLSYDFSVNTETGEINFL